VVIGQRRTGGTGGGETRCVGMSFVGGIVWVHRLAFELDGVFVSLPFGYGCIRCFLFLLRVCHPYSLRSLRSCVCSPVCALSLSLYSFFSISIPSAVLFSQSCVLFAQFIAQSERGPSSFSTYTDFSTMSCSHSTLRPVPDRGATAYCTYVFTFKVYYVY